MDHSKIEDKILKEAWATFAKEGLEFFGIKEKAKLSGPTEAIKLNFEKLYLDYTYLMENDVYYHFEFMTTNNNKKDLRKFRAYEAWLSNQEGKDVVTFVIYTNRIKRPNNSLKTGINTYAVRSIMMAKFDGEVEVQKVRKKIENNTSLTNDDAVAIAFRPLMGDNKTKKEKIIESLDLSKHFPKALQPKIEAVVFGFALKFLENEELKQVKERIRMTVLGQMIYDDGLEKGIEKGIEQGIIALIESLSDLGVSRELTRRKILEKFEVSPEEADNYLEKYYR